ncbi:hypothetical protein BD413DRAFT_163631 [Trametes elegans]|nr:hypothetical protein BD413DRAFT_163631 [Trametes elegans]
MSFGVLEVHQQTAALRLLRAPGSRYLEGSLPAVCAFSGSLPDTHLALPPLKFVLVPGNCEHVAAGLRYSDFDAQFVYKSLLFFRLNTCITSQSSEVYTQHLLLNTTTAPAPGVAAPYTEHPTFRRGPDPGWSSNFELVRNAGTENCSRHVLRRFVPQARQTCQPSFSYLRQGATLVLGGPLRPPWRWVSGMGLPFSAPLPRSAPLYIDAARARAGGDKKDELH